MTYNQILGLIHIIRQASFFFHMTVLPVLQVLALTADLVEMAELGLRHLNGVEVHLCAVLMQPLCGLAFHQPFAHKVRLRVLARPRSAEALVSSAFVFIVDLLVATLHLYLAIYRVFRLNNLILAP